MMYSKALIALLAMGSTANAEMFSYDNPDTPYETVTFYTSYIAEFGKDYQTIEEFRHRMAMFAKTSEFIRRHNAR